MDVRRGFFRSVFLTTTGWAMIFCLAGAVSVLFPWVHSHGRIEGFSIGGMVLRMAPGGSYNGFVTWHGLTTAITFFLLFLTLVALSPLEPVPLWRSLIVLGAAGPILLFSGLFIGEFSFYPFLRVQAGPYVALVLGLGLVFLATLEIRGKILERVRRQRLGLLTPREAILYEGKEKAAMEDKPVPRPDQVRSAEGQGPPG